MRGSVGVVGAVVAFASLTFATSAAALQQPNGVTIPSAPGCSGNQPTGLLPIFACECTQPNVCNIGGVCPSQNSCPSGQNSTCESTMWHSFNDNTCIPSNHSGIDPVAAATLAAQTFHPTCALTFTVVSRGHAMFDNVFGWYNATGKPPPPSDLHVMLGCNDGVGTSVTLDLSKEPSWLGGDIGFFLLTPEAHGNPGSCASNDCCPTVARLQNGEGWAYTTERAYDPDQQNAIPFIHVLAYDSTVWPQKFYFAMEDTYGGGDNDFADLVTSVGGVECSGAGEMCSSGKPGACALGITTCTQGKVTCQQVVQPKPEACNGVDDDCNGQVDDGAMCSDPGDVCWQGKCVHRCGSVEFPCAMPTVCDAKSGLCLDPACVGVTCASGQVCRSGACAAPCGGVVCPHGQTCVGDACVDLCANVSCASGQVCLEGVCVPGCGHCGGVTCVQPLACAAMSGICADPSCSSPCPAGTYCKGGSCVDDCNGAVCPDGQTCRNGQCAATTGADAGGGIVQPPGADAGAAGGGGSGGGGGSADQPWNGPGKSGCACTAVDAGGAGGLVAAAAAMGVAALAIARRRRVD